MDKNTNKTKKKKSCEEFALNKLSYRMRTEKELRKMLADEGYESSSIEATISFLKDSRYLDDKSYVIEFFRAKRRDLKAIGYIVNSLYEKGINKDFALFTIEEYMTEDLEFSMSDKELALVVLNKMTVSQKVVDDKFKAKVARRLNSLGYSSSVIYEVINKLK